MKPAKHRPLLRQPGASDGALLAEATRTLGGTLDLGRLLSRLTELAETLLGADAAGAWLLEGDGTELHLKAHHGFKRPEVVARVLYAPGGDVLGWITDRPGPVVLRSLAASGRAQVRRWLDAEELGSFVGVPLIAEATPLGMLGLFRRRRRPFTRADLARAETLCVPAAPAILNTRLYAEQLARAERTAVLLAIAETAGASLALPAAIDDISERAARALEAQHCTIALWPGGVVPPAASVGEVEAARSKRPVELDDSLLVVPIVRKGDVIGAMTLAARVRRRWERSSVDLAMAIAGQIALVAENARLYRDAQTKADELAALRDVGTTLTSTLDLPTVLDSVASAALRLTGATRCVVFEADEADGRIVPRVSLGMPLGQIVILAFGQGAVGTAAARKAPFFSPDVWLEPAPQQDSVVEAPGETLGQVTRRQRFRAVLSVPLLSKEQVVGVIAIYWDEPHAYAEHEVRLLSGLAQQAAVAIEQARLHGASLRRAEQLAALLRAVRSIMGDLDTTTILDTIVREAAAIAGTPYVKLMLVDAESGVLRVGAQVGVPIPADFAIPVGQSFSGRVASTGQPVFVADTREHPDSPLTRRDREVGITTYLGLPVKVRDTVRGVLTFNTTAPRLYSADELAYLSSFADQAAIALDNARLYDDAQQALSDLRTMQQRLVQGETLRALGELAGGAAHHLNNLLTIVVGRIQLLRRTLNDERTLGSLETIERAAKDGAEVVRRLQQFAGMRRTAQPRAVDLNEVVTEALELTRVRWQDSARGAGLEIVAEPRLESLPPIAGDPAALRELLTNLIMNAVDAMPAGGRITVETRLDGARAVVLVTDTGSGMPEEVRLRAHEPFFTTKGVKSTGLGLSVSYGIARRHGGELTINSEVGRGTTVHVQLPVAGVTEPVAPLAPAVRRRPLRILLVDDEEDVRLALAEMLASQGHTVMPAGSGEDALGQLDADSDIELVLTDLVMPAMTGWEVAAAAKARRPTLPVGVITGWGDLPEAVAGPRAAVDFIISKPINLEELIEAVARVGAR